MKADKIKKKKVNIPFCVACILFCLTLISVHFTSGLYARYTDSVTVNDKARVAIMASDATVILNNVLIAPGESNTIALTVTNYDSDKVCEVAQKYSLSVNNITGNIPFTLAVYSDSNCQNIVNNPQGTFIAGVKESATYWIKISWPKEANAASYAFEIDAIEIVIDAEQID